MGRLAIIVVWDGLRPDWVTPEVTPTLHALANGGVCCTRSHCVYPSETRVNATALATGFGPGRSGITANSIHVSGFDLGPAGDEQHANTGDHTHLARIAQLDPPLVYAPALADAVVAAGGVAVVASSGSPGAAFLQAGQNAPVLNHALLRPDSFAAEIVARFGPPPRDSYPATARSDWMTLGLLDLVLPERVLPAIRAGKPALIHWWLTDPDHTAHHFGLGEPAVIQSLRENDRRLATLMQALKTLGLTDQTDILLTSDHGFSTTGPRMWTGNTLRSAGLIDGPTDAEVFTTRQGGAITLLSDAKDLARHAASTVTWLQHQPWVGAIFARDSGPAAGLPGTLPLSVAWNGRVGPRAPDIRFSTQWSDATNALGIPGSVLAGSREGGASHGTASPYDMRNSLFAWGPSFKEHHRSDVPTGIIDIAPTIRKLLGLPPVDADGRVLVEALRDGGPAPTVKTETLSASAEGYRQEAVIQHVGATTYLERAGRTN